MKCILQIEHDQLSRKIIKDVLEKESHQVTQACNGSEALKLFCQTIDAWDLVLIEMNLPDMKAEEIIIYIRAARKSLPIIVFSNGDQTRINQLCSISAIHYLPESYSPGLLTATINHIL